MWFKIAIYEQSLNLLFVTDYALQVFKFRSHPWYVIDTSILKSYILQLNTGDVSIYSIVDVN